MPKFVATIHVVVDEPTQSGAIDAIWHLLRESEAGIECVVDYSYAETYERVPDERPDGTLYESDRLAGPVRIELPDDCEEGAFLPLVPESHRIVKPAGSAEERLRRIGDLIDLSRPRDASIYQPADVTGT